MNFLDALSFHEVESVAPFIQLLQIFFSLLSSLKPPGVEYPKQAHVQDGQSFDFIIVGAGSAGCVVANRLTEIGNFNVLLVEAGGEPGVLSDVPGLYALADYKTIDWGYYAENDFVNSQAYQSKKVRIPRGKMVSGSSGNNYMYYSRGNKVDYDNWANEGNKGWDWKSVLPYFLKSEKLEDAGILLNESAVLHNTKGNVGITRPEYPEDANKYFQAFQEAGHAYILDYNGYNQIGYSYPQYDISNGIRQSTGNTFIKPIKYRPNLFLLQHTLAKQVIINNNKAVGVEIKLPDGKTIKVYASKEVIISAGAINTPQLLMLSGIGPKGHLNEMGINLVLDAPLVGQLQDHVMAPLTIVGKYDPTTVVKNVDILTNLNKFPISIVGHVALNKSQTYPDYQIVGYPLPASSLLLASMCSYEFMLEDEYCNVLLNANRFREVFFGYVSLLSPQSRGQIKLRSINPEDSPLIYTGYFTNKNDLDNLVSGIEQYIKVLNTTYFRNVRGEIVDMKIKECNNFMFGSRDYWVCYVRNVATTEFHPASTCSMGPNAVLDERLKVRGLDNLRVVDASTMPTIVRGNLNAPVMMIAEKAADMIKVDHGVLTH